MRLISCKMKALPFSLYTAITARSGTVPPTGYLGHIPLSVLIAVKSTFSLHQSVCDNNRLFMCFCFLPVQ
uniref:Uncharacterized protein n=1 Tax=Anguilla anguilla TaxID=7936 RepID=A0A0E9UYW5_ANGAN